MKYERVQRLCKKHGLTTFGGTKRRSCYFRCLECKKESTKAREKKNKQRILEYKGGICIICGYDKCYRSLCFHHIDPGSKEFSISDKRAANWDRMKKELDKCVLVCSNCHGEIHDRMIDIVKLFSGSMSGYGELIEK